MTKVETQTDVLFHVPTPKSNILSCRGLSQAPSPDMIQDVFSAVLGDVFHAMDRTKVPVKHEAKKAFFVALREAFLVWNLDKLEELEDQMKKSGISEDEIKDARCYSPAVFRNCVDRVVPPPSVLYWRVRAVYVLYGNMIDSVTKKPLFNEAAWNKADNVLIEILQGFYSDPPGIQWYSKRLDEEGQVMTNKYGMELLDCARGTNALESYHKDLVITFGSWIAGFEVSMALLRWRQHFSNIRCSERKRFGFGKTGMFDEWLLEILKTLVLKNHGVLLYPNRLSSSEFKTTSETFDIVPLHDFDVHTALTERSKEVKFPPLSRDLEHLRKSIGAPAPFLPFTTKEEKKQFSKYAQSQSKINIRKATVHWNRHFVDGIERMPKLDCHLRAHLKKWQRNQRIKETFEKSKCDRGKLDELNAVLPNGSSRGKLSLLCCQFLITN